MSLKDFDIVSKLGQGAYSSVYKVQRHADGQIYALKKVKMNNLSEKEQQNALNEVRILASVKSSNIVGYKHAFIQSNSLCIVMQFSDDGDLYQKIVNHQKAGTEFQQSYIWKVLIQVVLGLKSLHQLNILHRDLKSANVFLSKDGTAKLGDMNVSKIAKNGLLYTQTGTPYYASPEVWKDKPYDSKSDIWSLGCVIYQMATLKPPFRAEDMDGLYKKIIKGSYQKIGDNYSKSLSTVIKSMLQVNPANRPSASQLLITLQSKAQQYGITLPSDSPQIHKQLLQTIRANKNLHYLTDRLPKSNYANGQQYEKVPQLSQSVKGKNLKQLNLHSNGSKHINLPKLDKIISKNNKNVYLINERSVDKKTSQIDMKSLLKIEGKSNQKMEQEPKRELQKSLKAQLRRIYNLRGQGKTKEKKEKNQQSKTQLQKDFKEELKKNYNIKPSPVKMDQQKPNYRNVQLPRIK